ncbi:MAG: hypothetical protein R6V46_18875 [Desulfatiglandaceae bacterium]
MRTIIALCIAVLLSSCATAPRTDNYPYGTQKRMLSVVHWDRLAREVARNQVIPSLSHEQAFHSIYVDKSDQTEFGKAFYTYLVTQLANHNVILSETPHGANVVKWSTQLVWNEKGCWFPGIALATYEVFGHFLAGHSLCVPPSDLELIFTAQVEKGSEILSRKTRNYYINPSDKWNFWAGNKNGYRYQTARR